MWYYAKKKEAAWFLIIPSLNKAKALLSKCLQLLMSHSELKNYTHSSKHVSEVLILAILRYLERKLQ